MIPNQLNFQNYKLQMLEGYLQAQIDANYREIMHQLSGCFSGQEFHQLAQMPKMPNET